MIQLIIDYATNKILGYNTIIPEDTTDLVLVDDDTISKFHDKDLSDKLYYEDGQIIIKENDSIYMELQELNDEELKLKECVENEYKLFMDNVISGKTIEEASSIAKSNREKLENIKSARIEFNQKLEKRRMNNILKKYYS